MKLEGRVWVFGDGLSAHDLMPGRYDPLIMARKYDEARQHVLEGSIPGWAEQVRPGDLIVAGDAFGAGKHHFAILELLRLMGVAGYLAASYFPSFQRACIDLGIPAITFHHQQQLSTGDTIRLDLSTGEGTNLTTGASFSQPPESPLLDEIISAGGWPQFVVSRLSP